jgi:hypothetical protein
MATKSTLAETPISEKLENQDKAGTTVEADGKLTEQPKYSKEELLAIFDEMIFSGDYEENVTIKGKLKVIFKARSAEDTTKISKDIDAKNFTLISTLQEHRSLQNLAYSLVNYSGQDWRTLAVEDRLKKINKLPSVIVGALSQALFDFDNKISAACQEGEANF